jgi:hypothetical protein
LSSAGVASASDPAPSIPKDSAKKEKAAPDTSTPDRIVLRSGKVVEGRILEETDSQIVMNVVVAGIVAKTTYPKSDVLEIKRGVGTVDKAVKATDAAKTDMVKKEAKKEETEDPAPSADAEEDPDLVRLYVVELKGRFGWDISKTSLTNLFAEADKELGDTIVDPDPPSGVKEFGRVVDPSKRDKNIIVLKMDTGSEPQFGSIFQTENIAPVVKHQIVEKGRRVVFWVQRATGGAAIFPFMSPDIYFTPEGRLGGVVDLDEFSSGDHMVDEKLISAYMGHAEGFLIKGGYEEHVKALRAMLRKHIWLLVRFEGGKPIYLDREPKDEETQHEWTILSDDGEGENKDEAVLVGNDLFLLEPDWAEKLGISDGTVETIDDLAFRLGVQRHYKAIEKNKAQKAADAWKTGIEEAVRNINPEERPGLRLGRLWREFNEIDIDGDFNDRKRDRGRKINLLKQIREILTKYAEVFDPEGQWRAKLDVDIATLQLEAEEDARGNRGGNDNGGGGGGGPRRGGGGPGTGL